MSLGDNLQNLRKKENMSQEALAERLEVSRQAVSKWESGGAYPETEKIISICKIFGCTMDQLVMGEISFTPIDLNTKKYYDDFYNSFSKAMAFGVGLILFGVTSLLAITSYSDTEKSGYIAVGVLLFCILVAVTIFICYGIREEELKKKITTMEQVYSESEIENFKRKFPFAIAGGVGLILFGVIIMMGLSAFEAELSLPVSPAVFLLLFVTIAVPIFIYFGIQEDKYNIEKYNQGETDQQKKAGSVCGVVMLIATFLFLFSGFVFDSWKVSWAVFPLGGIICGIVSIIMGVDKK
ncbi:MAG: helix-turn-helix transcriptional regulator [Oscillospiraceae bacterium]